LPSWEEHLDEPDSSTSARMMKSEERTTELVAARSTPSVLLVRAYPETRDHSNDQAEDSGLESRRQKIVEGHVLKPFSMKS